MSLLVPSPFLFSFMTCDFKTNVSDAAVCNNLRGDIFMGMAA